jgi:pimeloyl-ACP methyl ester carboxylesterase
VSGGEFNSLGYFETTDVEFLLKSLEMSFGFVPLALWTLHVSHNRSFLVNSPSVAGRIADSPFSPIPDVCPAIGGKLSVGAIFVQAALAFLKISLHAKACFNWPSAASLEAAQKSITVPFLICQAEDDEFIPISQSQARGRAYWNKRVVARHGGDDRRRPLGWIDDP